MKFFFVERNSYLYNNNFEFMRELNANKATVRHNHNTENKV